MLPPITSISGRRVLVLGGGFIGSSVARALLDDGHFVVVLTRSEPVPERRRLLTGATLVIGEAGRMDLLANLLPECDDVLYAVGSSTPAESELDPAADISVVVPPLVRVLELIRLHPRVRLTLLSSGGTVYGNAAELPVPESAATRPVSSYGILKLACENYVAMYSDVHGVDSRVLRLSNPYGPGQDWAGGQGLVARAMHSARTGEPMTLFSHGETVRDYIHVDDLALIIAKLIGLPEVPPVLNVASGVGHSTKEVVDAVREVTRSAFEIWLQPSRGYDVLANVLDVSALRRLVPIAVRSLGQGLADTWAVEGTSPHALRRSVAAPRRASREPHRDRLA